MRDQYGSKSREDAGDNPAIKGNSHPSSRSSLDPNRRDMPAPDNPWGATTMRDLRLYQLGCFLVFANVLAWIGFLVTFLIWGAK